METEEKNKKIKERSSAYPSIGLEEAIEKGIKIDESYGRSQFSRESAVTALGYSKLTGTSAQRFAALVHFGLIVKQKGAYVCSDLLRKIIHPNDDQERMQSIKIAAKNPKLFLKLIQENTGKPLPALLNNIISNNHGINRKVADNVVEIFKKSILYAGLYKNGIVQEDVTLENITQNEKLGLVEQQDEEIESPIGGQKNVSHNQAQKNYPETPFVELPLPSGATILYPPELKYRFAMGDFAQEIRSFDQAVSKAIAEMKNDITSD